ncbi:MAG: hypothetical protein J0H44_28095 [Alphaproteobacteria bacterium]|jgi:hypothetical protein|nr:hypothetical protein [Alphaproteobacteria bacterium]
MRIFNPTFGLSAAGGETMALKPVNWKSDAIALFSNSKPNARELLDGIRSKLGAFRPVENINFVAKNSASQPAPKDLIEEVAAKYRGALLAIAD